MRAADAFTIEWLGIPGFTLMEVAGRESARLAAAHLDGPSDVLVCVGKGNNGGDGLVVARWLADKGHRVRVLMTATVPELSPDCAANHDILTRMVLDDLAKELSILESGSWSLDELVDMPADLIIDALFGTGLESALRAPYADLVRAINTHPAPVLALDMPSGLSATSGIAFDPHIRAVATVTMGALKAGLLLEQGPDCSGEVHAVDIGIPASVLRREAANRGSGFRSTDDWVSAHLRPRVRTDHKYTTGPTLIVGGSEAFPGAPALAARAAARTGSGYVVAIGPESIRARMQESLDAIPVAGFDPAASADTIVSTLEEELDNRWTKARSLLIGPGLGREEGVAELVLALVARFDGSIVLDAGALFAIAPFRDQIATQAKGRVILTPHDGELSRLDPEDAMPGADSSRISRVERIATAWQCTVLAKGQPSITAAPDGRVIVNGSGHPAAATAGSGDVLAGIVSGLLAQGLEPFAAAAAGIHIGGTAVSQFVERGASQSLVASDIIEALPATLRSLS